MFKIKLKKFKKSIIYFCLIFFHCLVCSHYNESILLLFYHHFIAIFKKFWDDQVFKTIPNVCKIFLKNKKILSLVWACVYLNDNKFLYMKLYTDIFVIYRKFYGGNIQDYVFTVFCVDSICL